MQRRSEYEEVSPDGTHRVASEVETSAPVTPIRSAAGHESVAEQEVMATHSDGVRETRWGLSAVSAWVGVFLLIVETLLTFRLAFGIFGANRESGFVDFVYGATGWLVAPFQGIAEDTSNGEGGVFEPATVIAMAVYLVAALLLVAVLNALSASMGPGHVATTRTRHAARSGHDHDDYTRAA